MIDLWASLDVHIEETITAGTLLLKRYYYFLEVSLLVEFLILVFLKYIQEYLTEIRVAGWNFPKTHVHVHLFDDILAKGVSINANTKYDKAMHVTLKDSYQNHGTFHNPAGYVGATLLSNLVKN